MKECIFCKKEFEPNKPKQKFCSNKCRVYFNREDISEGGFVYCLRNPLNKNEIFYVGKTIISLNKRLDSHIRESSKRNDKKSSVIKSILDAGEDVIIEQIEVITANSILETEKILNEREKFWINEYCETKDLTNKANNKKYPHKSNPIGVRFDDELLSKLKNANIVDSPQKALNLYEKCYIELIELKIDINKQTKNKERVLTEISGDTSNLIPSRQKDNKTQNNCTEKEPMPVWNSKLEKYSEFIIKKNKWIKDNNQ